MRLTKDWMRTELEGIRNEKTPAAKGKRLEILVRRIFCQIPGMSVDDEDVESAYHTQEIDLYFFNDRDPSGLHFLDCPLIVECKGWTAAVDGKELRYFATLLRDRGRRDGIFVALNGITGDAKSVSAGFYHVTTALAGGQLVLVVTGDDLVNCCDGASLVALLRRRMLDQVRAQVLAIGASAQRVSNKGRSKKNKKGQRRSRRKATARRATK